MIKMTISGRNRNRRHDGRLDISTPTTRDYRLYTSLLLLVLVLRTGQIPMLGLREAGARLLLLLVLVLTFTYRPMVVHY